MLSSSSLAYNIPFFLPLPPKGNLNSFQVKIHNYLAGGVFFGKIFNFPKKTPKNVGGERKNFIFSLSSHTRLSSYLFLLIYG
jgi:hypothetical protein